jgi:hypothetical protein
MQNLTHAVPPAQTVSTPSINDLWALAAAELSEDDRRNINFSCEKRQILEDLLELARGSEKRCVEKRWRYTRKSGETVILRDLFCKIVKWIDIFKQVGDNAVQYDPVHAALPWAAVRFVLQVNPPLPGLLFGANAWQIAVNDIGQFAFMVENMTAVAQLIARYALFENLYLRQDTPAARELEKTVVRLYGRVLIYLSKSKSYFEQNSASECILGLACSRV